jgi:phenylacetate-CoA ligase
VTLASEATSARQRAQIEAAFGLQPLEHYAQREAVANASQCPLGRLHIDEDFSLVELIPQPEIASGCFRMVGTSLDNWHQPFIRYDPGDLARYDSTDRCSCGRMGRVLQAIEGRSSDYVLRKNGAMIGQLDHIFKPLSYIREAQVRQARPGSVEISVVPRGDWTVDHRRKLVVEAQRWLGAEMQIGVHVVDHLPRTAAGKFRFVVREDLARGD